MHLLLESACIDNIKYIDGWEEDIRRGHVRQCCLLQTPWSLNITQPLIFVVNTSYTDRPLVSFITYTLRIFSYNDIHPLLPISFWHLVARLDALTNPVSIHSERICHRKSSDGNYPYSFNDLFLRVYFGDYKWNSFIQALCVSFMLLMGLWLIVADKISRWLNEFPLNKCIMLSCLLIPSDKFYWKRNWMVTVIDSTLNKKIKRILKSYICEII